MKNRGFTLIELLVVISIIGVIASIVLVSFSGSRDKAKLAKSQQFSANINHSLGAYAVGIWRFEEGAGINIHDESGYGNHGTFYGNPTPVFPDGVYSGTKALQFDGVDDYVDCDNDPSLNITDALTIEAWIYPQTIDPLTTILAKQNSASTPGQAYGMHITSNKLQYRASHQSVSSDSNIETNIWSHVVATIDGDYVKLYINGGLDKSEIQSGTPIITTKPVQIGYRGEEGGGGGAFNGTIDDVRIYNETLSVGQIQQHYAIGAAKHGIALNK